MALRLTKTQFWSFHLFTEMAGLISFSEFTYADRIANIRITAHRDGLLIYDPDYDDLRPWLITIRNSANQVVKLMDPTLCPDGSRILTKRRYLPERVLNNGQDALIKFDLNPFLPKDLPADLYSLTLVYYLGGIYHTGQYEFRLQ